MAPDFSFEDEHDGPVCGVDEVGRGPLAGPVVAAAVIIRRAEFPADALALIDDSKKLTAATRAWLHDKIHLHAHVSIAACTVGEIDRINILQASLRAMKKAVAALAIQPVVALVDGNKAPKLECTVKTIIGGDALSLSIAAASIVAKHHRDLIMQKHAKRFPHYGWATNAGYGTAGHLKAIQIHGVTSLHRRSFSPIAHYLDKVNYTNN